jgi:outer membrane murein-binding lipoprotein Lpp
LLEKEKIMTNNVSNKWEELKALVESLEEDVQKNATGNKAAGTRARKGLRSLKTTAAELVKLTLGKE